MKVIYLLLIVFFLVIAQAQEPTEPEGDLAATNSTDANATAAAEEAERQRLAEEERLRQEERCRRLACYVFTADGTAYDLTPLEKRGNDSSADYLKPVDGSSTLEYNFCKHLKDSAYFARWISWDFPTKLLTSEVCEPDAVSEVIKNDEIIGLQVQHISTDTVCNVKYDEITKNHQEGDVVYEE